MYEILLSTSCISAFFSKTLVKNAENRIIVTILNQKDLRKTQNLKKFLGFLHPQI